MYCDGSFGPLLLRKELIPEFLKFSPLPFTLSGLLLEKKFNILKISDRIFAKFYLFSFQLLSGLVLAFLAIEDIRVIQCTDCMFYVKKRPQLKKSDFLPLARKLTLNEIHFEDQSFSFTCEEAKIQCNLGRAKNGVAQPPCCLGKCSILN